MVPSCGREIVTNDDRLPLVNQNSCQSPQPEKSSQISFEGPTSGANDFDKAQILAAADDPWATRLRTGGASKGGSVGRIW